MIDIICTFKQKCFLKKKRHLTPVFRTLKTATASTLLQSGVNVITGSHFEASSMGCSSRVIPHPKRAHLSAVKATSGARTNYLTFGPIKLNTYRRGSCSSKETRLKLLPIITSRALARTRNANAQNPFAHLKQMTAGTEGRKICGCFRKSIFEPKTFLSPN